MTRPLLHPLSDGSVTRTPAGAWATVRDPDVLASVDLREKEDRAGRVRISSVPTPWARLQLFRDAVLEKSHPFHDEALNDILDSLELVLFQDLLRGLQLRPETISLQDLTDKAAAGRTSGVSRFVGAVRELAPKVGKDGPRLAQVTVMFNGPDEDAPVLFATSPFTLFFTPATRRGTVPGYYTGPAKLRPLAERPPALAWYVQDVLLPQIGSAPVGGLPEMQALSTLLNEQLAAAYPDGTGATHEPANLEPGAGIEIHRLKALSLESELTIRPTRPLGAGVIPPLVLNNSGRSSQSRYFRWLARPTGTVVDPTGPRGVLPGTAWKHAWVYPETDFLAERLMVFDAPLFDDRVHAVPTEAAVRGSSLGPRILPPLRPEFFEFFRAADVPGMLSVKVLAEGDAPRVKVSLSVPTSGEPVIVERTYEGVSGSNSHLSLWPGFQPARGAFEWKDYYLIHYLEGEDAAAAIGIEVGSDGGVVTARAVQRDISTVLYHFATPPEFIHVRGRSTGAEGVILPRLKSVGAPTLPPWKVAIDFGTSNTVVAYLEADQEPRALTVSEATRWDLTQGASAAAGVSTYFDTFFFPAVVDGSPFATVILKNRSVVQEDPSAVIPALTANIPFRGEIGGGEAGSQYSNQLVGDLKWGGGGTDTNRLTQLFLHQILQVVHAEALAKGAHTDGIQYSVSYPIAFSLTRQGSIRQQWSQLVRSFGEHRTAGQGAAGDDASGQPPIEYLDESTASMLYFQTDPASQSTFTVEARAVKLTADVGGGTTDVAGYARGGPVLRMSMLFGGRDLIGEGGERSIYKRLQQWAVENRLPRATERVLGRYPSEHTRFTYLVRQPWFASHRGTLGSEPWFIDVQACIAYFFSVIVYNIGLRLRAAPPEGVAPPDILYFAGNGASYLTWLTQFERWNGSVLAPPYTRVFQQMLEAGYGNKLPGSLQILTSSRPKLEVVLGLLAARRRATTDADVPSDQPLGEDVSLPTQDGKIREWKRTESLGGAAFGPQQVSALEYTAKVSDWEITRFNQAFIESLQHLTRIDRQWPVVAERVARALAACDEGFYDNRLKGLLAAQLETGDVDNISLFVLEAAATLRELERRLIG